MKHVYVGNNSVCHYVIESLNSDMVIMYTELDQFSSVNSPDKFALFHFSGLESENLVNYRSDVAKKLNRLIKQCRDIVIFSSELNFDDACFFRRYRLDNILLPLWLCRWNNAASLDGLVPYDSI